MQTLLTVCCIVFGFCDSSVLCLFSLLVSDFPLCTLQRNRWSTCVLSLILICLTGLYRNLSLIAQIANKGVATGGISVYIAYLTNFYVVTGCFSISCQCAP